MKKKEKKLRIMFNTNAPWAPSGYGQQAAEFLPLIRDEGYPLACIAFYGLEGHPIEHDGIKMYPRIGSVWGDDAMVNHSKDFQADIVITFQDIWVLDPNALKQIERWIPLLPVDHDPLPPAIHERIKLAYRIITYSQFGRDQLKDLAIHSTYIQHTVDTDVFKPTNKAEAKKALGVPEDYFLFGMVAANKDNPPRKSFQEVIDAFHLFHKKHPKSAIYFHTLLEQSGGFPIKEYINFLGLNEFSYHLKPYDQMYRVKKPDMAKIYSAFDCLMAPSTSEGFGVPIVEAQSCGVPVITNNFSAMPELIEEGKTGFLTEIGEKRYTPLLSYIGIPTTGSVFECMEKIYKADRVKMGKEARKRAIRHYDTKTIFKKKWVPFLEKVEKEIYGGVDTQTA